MLLPIARQRVAFTPRLNLAFRLRTVGTSELTLLELASGSVQQEVTFAERDGRSTIDSYRLNFHIHFQACSTRPWKFRLRYQQSPLPTVSTSGKLHFCHAAGRLVWLKIACH